MVFILQNILVTWIYLDEDSDSAHVLCVNVNQSTPSIRLIFPIHSLYQY